MPSTSKSAMTPALRPISANPRSTLFDSALLSRNTKLDQPTKRFDNTKQASGSGRHLLSLTVRREHEGVKLHLSGGRN